MNFDFDVIYPTDKRLKYDGGKNNKYDKYLIPDNESPDCQNVIFDNGSVETRLGTAKFNSTAVGSFVGDGLYTRHNNDGTQSMCAWFGGTLHIAGVSTFVSVPSSTSIFTAGVRVCAAEYENYIFFNNGNNNAYKYNSHFTRHGIPAPLSAPSAASGGTGILSGTYRYAYTNVNSNLVESDLSPLPGTFTASANQISVSNILTTPVSYGVMQRYVYRTVNSGSTLFRVTILSNNVATSFTDNAADSSLGTQAPDDQGEPPRYSTIITHQNRLWCNDTSEKNLVWYSELDNPYIFKANNFEIIGDNSGETIKGFAIHDNGLIVFTENSEYLIYMPSTDPTNWEVVKLRSAYGSKSPFGVFSYNNKQMFPAVQNSKFVGFAAISGDAVDPEATLLTVSAAGSDLKSDRIEPDIFNVQSVNIDRISSMVFKNKAYITVTYGDGNTVNNRVYVFDFSISNLSKSQEASWVPWTGLNAEQMTIYNGTLYYISSNGVGFVYEMNKAGTYNDSGTAIDSYFWTKEFPGKKGDEQTHKDFRYTNILYEKAGGYFMDLFYRVDSDNSSGNRVQIDLNPGSSLWGTMIWGVDTWGGGNAAGEEKVFLGQLRGKRIQFKFTNQNTAGQKFKVYGQQFGYNEVGRR